MKISYTFLFVIISILFVSSLSVNAHDTRAYEMRTYYATRSDNIKIQGWSEQMAGLLGKESRLHMRPFLESKGFLKR